MVFVAFQAKEMSYDSKGPRSENSIFSLPWTPFLRQSSSQLIISHRMWSETFPDPWNWRTVSKQTRIEVLKWRDFSGVIKVSDQFALRWEAYMGLDIVTWDLYIWVYRSERERESELHSVRKIGHMRSSLLMTQRWRGPHGKATSLKDARESGP